MVFARFFFFGGGQRTDLGAASPGPRGLYVPGYTSPTSLQNPFTKHRILSGLRSWNLCSFYSFTERVSYIHILTLKPQVGVTAECELTESWGVVEPPA